MSPDPSSAWPQTENSRGYPRYLFDDPRSRLVAPALRASYALTGSLETDSDRGDLTGVHIILSDGGTETVREQRAAALLKTGLFYGASRFRIIEGNPDPPEWLEVFETDLRDPLTAYARAYDAAGPNHQPTEFINEARARSCSSPATKSTAGPQGRRQRLGGRHFAPLSACGRPPRTWSSIWTTTERVVPHLGYARFPRSEALARLAGARREDAGQSWTGLDLDLRDVVALAA